MSDCKTKKIGVNHFSVSYYVIYYGYCRNEKLLYQGHLGRVANCDIRRFFLHVEDIYYNLIYYNTTNVKKDGGESASRTYTSI